MIRINIGNYEDIASNTTKEELETIFKRISERMTFMRRQSDVIGHIGGDDFVIVTTPEKADEIAKKSPNKCNHIKKPVILSNLDQKEREGSTPNIVLNSIITKNAPNAIKI